MNAELQPQHAHPLPFVELYEVLIFGGVTLFVSGFAWLLWGNSEAWRNTTFTLIGVSVLGIIIRGLKNRHTNKMRNMTGVVVAVLAVALLANVVSAPAASAAVVKPTTHQMVVLHEQGITVVADVPYGMALPQSTSGAIEVCGWVTCSVYLTHYQTWLMQNDIAAWGGGINGMSAACSLLTLMTGPFGIITAAVCASLVLVYGGIMTNAIKRAAADGGCLRIRYPIWGFYDDHSGYCHKS